MLTKPILAFGTALALAGCSASSQSLIQNDEAAVINAIERDATLACGYTANAEDLGTLLAVADPTLAPAGAAIAAVAKLYAAAICNGAAAATSTMAARLRSAPPGPLTIAIDGVPLRLTPAK